MTEPEDITQLLHRFQAGDEDAQSQLINAVHDELRQIAARVMRRILVDHARKHIAGKRGGGIDILPLNEGIVFTPGRSSQIVQLDEALSRLNETDERAAKVIELRFFGGLSVEECAEVMGISPRTVKREWMFARAWLRTEFGLGPEEDAAAV